MTLSKHLLYTILMGLLFFTGTNPATAKTVKLDPKCDSVLSPHCANKVTPTFDSKGNLWIAWATIDNVYVSSSEDKGKSFSKPVKIMDKPITMDNSEDNRPKIVAAHNSDLYVTFIVKGKKKYTGLLLFSRSLDGGKSFSTPLPISDEKDLTSQRFDNILVDSTGKITIAWLDKRDRNKARAKKVSYIGTALYMVGSQDRGETFTPNHKILDSTCECCRIGMKNNLEEQPVVVWRQIFGKNTRDHAIITLNGRNDKNKMYRVSVDNWDVDACPHHGPAIAIDQKGTYHVVWFTAGKSRQGLFYGSSHNKGKTFSTPQAFGDSHLASHPDIFSHKSTLFIAWKEFNSVGTDLYVKTSDDDGKSWAKPLIITSTESESGHPAIISDSDWIYISWRTSELGYKLYKISKK